MALVLPRLYCIVDAGCFAAERDPTLAVLDFARELVAGGATLIQYRNKTGNARQMLRQARELRRIVAAAAGEGARGTQPIGARATLIMNDRADLCLAADFDGVHVGQLDLSAEGARRVVGNGRLVGVSGHSVEQVREADAGPADYIAIGPVFATASKENPDPVVGLEGVRAARAATRKPLVAIGGITRATCAAVFEAGADSVAVIGDLLKEPRRAVDEFLRICD